MTIVKSVSQFGCVSQDSDAIVSFGTDKVWGRQTADCLERMSKSSIHQVHASSSEYPGKERTIVGKNESEVPTLQNSRIGPTKRLDDNSDVPKARLWILPKTKHKFKENDRATFFSPTKKWVLPSASSRESCELIPVRVCISSVRKTSIRLS